MKTSYFQEKKAEVNSLNGEATFVYFYSKFIKSLILVDLKN